jgi:hypothetical protein
MAFQLTRSSSPQADGMIEVGIVVAHLPELNEQSAGISRQET